MADKINAIKIKQPNGSYSDQIPISVLVQNVQWDQDHSLLDALGSVDLSSSGKGNLQHQIDELDEDKISHDDFNSQLDEFLSQQIREDTESWLEENVNTGQTIGLTTNLTISGLAADAKAVGDAIDAKTFPIDNALSDSSTNPVQNKVVTSAISELNGSLVELEDDVDIAAGWEQVGIAASDNDVVYAHHNEKMVKMTASESGILTVHGITITDIDHITNISYPEYVEEVDTDDVGHTYRLLSLAPNANNYNISGKVSGFTIGKTYRMCLKVTDPKNTKSGGGQYCSVMAGTTTISSRFNTVSEEAVFTTTFTAKAEVLSIYVHPFRCGDLTHTLAVGDTFRIDDFYINEINGNIDLYTHENVFSKTVTGTSLKYPINKGAFVAVATMSANVYVARETSKLMTVNGLDPDEGGDITVKSHLQGKTAIVFGDSVMNKGAGSYKDCPYYLSKITGINVLNAAMGGTALHVRNNAKWDTVGFVNLVNMILSGDWSEMTALGSDTSFEIHDRVADLATVLSALDWSTVDYIVINYAGNDISTDSSATIIDNTENAYDTHTYLGAFRTAIEALLAEYPDLQVLVTTGVWRWWRVDGVVVTSEERLMANNHYYYEWGDALMECAQNEYHFPVFDFYRNLGANKLNYLEYSADGAHPEEEYLERMGSKLAAAMMSKF